MLLQQNIIWYKLFQTESFITFYNKSDQSYRKQEAKEHKGIPTEIGIINFFALFGVNNIKRSDIMGHLTWKTRRVI